jgi:hypothetical protein
VAAFGRGFADVEIDPLRIGDDIEVGVVNGGVFEVDADSRCRVEKLIDRHELYHQCLLID